MRVTPIYTNTYWGSDKRLSQNSYKPSFEAYVYKPGRDRRYMLSNLNPIKKIVDDIVDKTMKFARLRVRPLSKALKAMTQEVQLSDKNGKALTHAWDINPGDRKKYVLILHGTGQNITNLQNVYEQVVNRTDFAVLAPEFRGFGKDDFSNISSKSLLTDASSALDYLKKEKGVEPKDVLVIGHSLSCKVATDLAVKNKDLGGVVLFSPIDSFSESMNFDKSLSNKISKSLLFMYHKLKFLNRDFDKFYGIGTIIDKVASPVSIVHSKDDSFVNYSSSSLIAGKCKNLTSLCFLESGGHKFDKSKTEKLVEILNSY